MTDTIWPVQPKYLLSGPFQEKFANLFSRALAEDMEKLYEWKNC
jgi:hypothetical protein